MCVLDNKITIFTCTYNRAHTLVRTYQSLCKQTCKGFEWLIIDDGSTDNTKDLVREWIRNTKDFAIRYCYKENGGLHTAYNKAIEMMNTELCVCIDSDDWMPENAVHRILLFWENNKRSDVGGILGLDAYEDGRIIGGKFPEGLKKLKMIEMSSKYHHHGDVKVVHRVDLLKEVAPMPSFEGEKNFNPIYLFCKIDIKYPLLLLNEVLCYVEYQEDGMTNNIFRQYLNSPRSFSELRKLMMRRPDVSSLVKFKNAIHYVSSQLICRNKRWLSDSPLKLMTVLAVPFGLVLYLFIVIKAKK